MPGADCVLAAPTIDNAGRAIQFSKIAPFTVGTPVVISFTNSGCPETSTPIDVFAVFGLNAKGQSPFTHVGTIAATAASKTNRISFAVPKGPDPPYGVSQFSMSFSTKGSKKCYPPGYSGTWVLGLGAATCRARAACGRLAVSVKVLEPIRSGLAVHGHPYQFYPVDFREPKNSTTFVCRSGCADVLVSVTDKQTNQPMPGAKVKAALGAIAHVVTGAQFLCGPTGPCGKAISDQTTDGNGQVLLTYWAPGVIEQTSAKLRITATFPKKKQGTSPPNEALTVKPYLIYQHAGDLSTQQADTLAKWAHGPGAFTNFLQGTHYAEVIVETSASFLEGLEVAAESATKALAVIEVAEPIVGPVLAAHELYHVYTELSEREEIFALFLELNDLNPAGIGGVPFAAFGSPIPSALFQNYIANAGTFLPLNIGAGGLLWRYAKTLDFLKKHRDPAFGSQSTELKMYEVSHCDPDKGSCGPGYGNVIGSNTVVNPGIQPELYFEFGAQHNGFAHSFPAMSFTIPYDAVAWTEVQPRLKGVFK